jgi:hypothetical protein
MLYRFAVFANFVGLFFASCKTANPNDSAVQASASAPSSADENCADVDSVRQFRDIFHHLASNKNRYYPSEYFPDEFNQINIDDNEIRQMIYMPTDKAICYGNQLVNTTAGTGPDYLNRLEKRMHDDESMNKTELFYQNGYRRPFQDLTSTRDVFSEKGPATIIVFPGFVAEFFKPIPFEHVQNAKSSIFRSQFQAAVDKLSDFSWRNDVYGERQIPMSDVLKLSSLDIEGKSLVNMIFLPSLQGSLETIGETRDTAKLYLRRLNSFFAEIDRMPGQPGKQATQNIYLLGYSRGHLTAVDLAVLAREQHAPWANRVKGVINLAGVVYGTGIADDALLDTSSQTYQTVQKIKKANAALIGLEEIDTIAKGKYGPERAAIEVRYRAENMRQQVISAMDFIQDGPPAINTNIAQESLRLGLAAPTKIGLLNPFHMLSILQQFRRQTFEINNFVGLNGRDHFKAVSQWKRLFSQLLVGMETMTKASRVDWFATHVLPPDIKYYSISGSMPDRLSDETGMLENRYYGSRLPDFQVLRGNYYTILDQTNLDVNDSQVSYPMARLWPSLITKLNPKQPPVKTYYLGMTGTHHWGIAWTEAFKRVPAAMNLFPKTILLESLATFALQQQEK